MLQANPLIGLTCLLDVLTDLLACLRTKALMSQPCSTQEGHISK
jgi:hypothetical protein